MATLSKVPGGKELEDFVAALLQCTGHFVEKNIQERDVLELDIVATRYGEAGPEHRVFEVKGGNWGFSEVFKLLGWMTYLQINAGAFVATVPPQDRDVAFYCDRCEKVNIKLLVIDDFDTAGDRFDSGGFGRADDLLREIWRYSFWIERCLIEALRDAKRANPEALAPREALRYYNLINNGVFFARHPTERVGMLYDAYQEHPMLTLGAAREMAGAAFDADTPGTSPLIGEALRQRKHLLLQACMYLEHKARLAILKGAVDYLCQDEEREGAGGPQIIDLSTVGLPSSFRHALSRIKEQPHFWLYPLFWQVFLWGWGGFILNDREKEEFEELSRQTGLPVESIPTALEAFDWLFPLSGGSWFTQMPTASYRLVRLAPSPFCGIGAFQRLKRNDVEQYLDLSLGGQYTVRDMGTWHNSAATLLNESAQRQ